MTIRPKPHPLYPEPGAWVVGMRQRGLPQIDPPAALCADGLTKEQVRDFVSYEGLGYCVCSFVASDKIEDPKLRKLWAEANRALKAVVECLDESPKTRVRKPDIKRSTLIVKKGL